MAMYPRVCGIAGVSEDEQCPKGAVLRQLAKKLDDMESCSTRQPVFARLHVTSEACTCWKRKDPHAGQKRQLYPLITHNGKEAHPWAFYVNPTTKWTPPVQTINKDPHKYLHCYGGNAPPTKNCKEIDCQFSVHLDKKGKRDDECCYIDCELDKPGFREFRPRNICSHPAICRASCFDHPPANDYYNVEPAARQDPCIHGFDP